MNTSNSKFTWNNSPESPATVTINFEGETRTVPAGITVAAALLGHDDEHVCRSTADQDKRSPYCLMGVCFECLVEINGLQNRQACLEPVFEGMNVKRQHKVVDEKK